MEVFFPASVFVFIKAIVTFVPPRHLCCSPINIERNSENLNEGGEPFGLLMTVRDETCDVAVSAKKKKNNTKQNFAKFKRLYPLSFFIIKIQWQIALLVYLYSPLFVNAGAGILI